MLPTSPRIVLLFTPASSPELVPSEFHPILAAKIERLAHIYPAALKSIERFVDELERTL